MEHLIIIVIIVIINNARDTFNGEHLSAVKNEWRNEN